MWFEYKMSVRLQLPPRPMGTFRSTTSRWVASTTRTACSLRFLGVAGVFRLHWTWLTSRLHSRCRIQCWNLIPTLLSTNFAWVLRCLHGVGTSFRLNLFHLIISFYSFFYLVPWSRMIYNPMRTVWWPFIVRALIVVIGCGSSTRAWWRFLVSVELLMILLCHTDCGWPILNLSFRAWDFPGLYPLPRTYW